MVTPVRASPPRWLGASRVPPGGKVVISAVVVVVLLLNVLWNLPVSPIARGVQDVVNPLAAPLGLDQAWSVYAPPDSRLVSVEVDVRMADGQARVWRLQPGTSGVGWWARWIGLRNAVVKNPTVRPQLAQWVVRRLVKPGERAQDVTVVLRTENLTKPGDAAGGKSPASKILYQQTLGVAQ